MKKIFYILSFLLVANTILAQVNTNLVVSATPPASLLQWSISRETLTFIVFPSAQGIQGQYKIKTEIKLSDGTVVGKTDLNKSKSYTLSSATTIYNANDVVPMESMIFTGKYKTSLEKTGKLPADNYEICVQLVRPPDYVPFSEIKCKSFYLAATQLPILMKPSNEEVLNYDIAKTTITFRWTPVVPKPKNLVTYKILVFEVLENQNPVQAMRSNFPLLSAEVRGVTQYIWQPRGIISSNEKFANDSTKKGNKGHDYVGHVSLIKRTINPSNSDSLVDDDMEQGKATYVWTIQSFDNLGQPLGDGNVNADGVSEPTLFYISRRNVPNEKITFPPNSVAYKITFPPNAFFISEKITFPPNSIAGADKITFPPNSVFKVKKITFPPNSVASADKIVFPPNTMVEKIVFPPNAVVSADKITFPPNSVFQVEKITFPPNSVANPDKIVFPPNAMVEKIVFPPNAIVSADKITFPPNSIVEKITFPPNAVFQLDKITFPPNSIVYKITFPPNVFIRADKITFPPNVSQ